MSSAEQTIVEISDPAAPVGLMPAFTIREGAIAASIWRRQAPSGSAYYEFSLSRAWKSATTGKSGYSRNFLARNRDELARVIDLAVAWIEEHQYDVEAAA